MATFNKFEGFIGYVGLGAVNLNTDLFKVYLTNVAPSASLDDVKTDLAEIASGGGYTAGGDDITNTYSEAAGTGTFGGTSVVFTATAGGIAQFRYAVIYDDTHASDILMGWYDYGSAVDLADTETLTVTFGASIATFV